MGIWFAGNAGEGHEPWKTDGTVAGTRQVADVLPGAMSSEPDHFTNVNTLVYFTAIDGVHGRELWNQMAQPAAPCSSRTSIQCQALVEIHDHLTRGTILVTYKEFLFGKS